MAVALLHEAPLQPLWNLHWGYWRTPVAYLAQHEVLLGLDEKGYISGTSGSRDFIKNLQRSWNSTQTLQNTNKLEILCRNSEWRGGQANYINTTTSASLASFLHTLNAPHHPFLQPLQYGTNSSYLPCVVFNAIFIWGQVIGHLSASHVLHSNQQTTQCPEVVPKIQENLINTCGPNLPTLLRRLRWTFPSRYRGRNPQWDENSALNMQPLITAANDQGPAQYGNKKATRPIVNATTTKYQTTNKLHSVKICYFCSYRPSTWCVCFRNDLL